MLPQQSLLKSLHYACWYVIDNNNKHGATGVTFNCSRFSEFKKLISWDEEKIGVLRDLLTSLPRNNAHCTESSPLDHRIATRCRQKTCTDVHPQVSQQLCRIHGDCNTTVSDSHLVDIISKDKSLPPVTHNGRLQ